MRHWQYLNKVTLEFGWREPCCFIERQSIVGTSEDGLVAPDNALHSLFAKERPSPFLPK
jgi:hypothetical protein